MDKIKVWTKQNIKVLDEIEKTGRYLTKREFIKKDLGDEADLVLETYDWLVKNGPKASEKPDYADYPVWVSFSKDATMKPEKGFAVLELEIDEDMITYINIEKWGMILNYSYIPKDEEDEKRHKQLLKDYGTGDAQAYMSRFYPQIKMEIQNSWKRLFDDSISMGNNSCYGNIWEVRKEWILGITK